MKKKKEMKKKVSWKIFVLAGLVVLLLSLSVFTLTGKSVVANGKRCVDSDGGIKPLIPGTCKNYDPRGRVYATDKDSCSTSTTLKEYYCNKAWLLATPVCASTSSKCTSCTTNSTGSYCCIPKTCAGLNLACGSYNNECGGTVDCGTCPAGQICDSFVTGKCIACTPRTCANVECGGIISDGCGGTRNCGNCSTDKTCFKGKCITPCSTGICQPMGRNCGNWTETCPSGQKISCGTCSTGQVCDNSMGICVTKT